jgi:hypothetical protein
MPLERSAMAVPSPSAPAASHESGVSFDQRWAAWVAKGAARDRAFRRKLAVAAPIVIIIVAIIVFALLR